MPRGQPSREYQERRKRDPEETDEEYLDRMDRVTKWPERSTTAEARWIWRAQVVIGAMKFLHDKSGGDYAKLRMPGKYSFNPKDFYYYSWICLREGFGVRSWKISPPLPPGDLSIHEKTEWFYKRAQQDQEMTLARWYEGKELRDITGEWTLKGLAGSAPYWLEAIETVEKKVQENTDVSHPVQADGPGTKKRTNENRLSAKNQQRKKIKRDL
ncbi:hypothetical protein BO71DRAFT_398314 [Aspergillus ellipticus CBS 707.79]|uniref:Uncharacterized protein n=1 Tax=Aspergillus ellipticus CBS 707.79 TaxID=1448320 RepID=A0A319DCG5_9EURO|nr:hypothetical protein BO71DRAFT_398314 [Aspergillus ellipticus CBS 707.79]